MRKENMTVMKHIGITSLVFIAAVSISSCGNSKKEVNAELKTEKSKSDAEIRKLEEELAKLDTNAANSAKIKLVSASPVATQNFEHYIDLQGKVDADNISYITPRMGPAQVKAVYVHQGQYVKKGQLLLKLDDAIIQQTIVAARQGLVGIKTQLGFAKNIYQRQKNLWDQGIGTEVQLITAKTNVEGLENQLKSAEENVKVAIAQQNTSNVYSDVNGVADQVNIRVGETFQGVTNQGVQQIKIVNTSSLKIVTNVPENYLNQVSKLLHFAHQPVN
jgi:RND family efflux transporter MFP subunit